MCVLTEPNAKIYSRVVGYKIFLKTGRRLTGLFYDSNGDDDSKKPYEIGKTYTSVKGPGFQAFTSHREAKTALRDWGGDSFVIREVILTQVQLGVISSMGRYSDGKLGWIAKHMTILTK